MLELKNLHHYYGGVHVLKGIDLRVAEGEVVALVGGNGAGKTTTLRCISGLLSPRSGQVLLGGKDIRQVAPHAVSRLGVGHVLEGRHLFPYLTVLENLRMGAYLRRQRDGAQGDLEEMFEMFPKLAERKEQLAGTLSGGEQQMVAIARALMGRPRLLLMDEPSVGLAPVIVKQIFGVIPEIAKRGCTVLLVEQNAQIALGLADRGYVMELGKITLTGTGAELLKNERVRQSYLGLD